MNILNEIVEEAFGLSGWHSSDASHVAKIAACLAVRRASFDSRLVEEVERRMSAVADFIVFMPKTDTAYGPFTSNEADMVLAGAKATGLLALKIEVGREEGVVSASDMCKMVYRDRNTAFWWTEPAEDFIKVPLHSYWKGHGK